MNRYARAGAIALLVAVASSASSQENRTLGTSSTSTLSASTALNSVSESTTPRSTTSPSSTSTSLSVPVSTTSGSSLGSLSFGSIGTNSWETIAGPSQQSGLNPCNGSPGRICSRSGQPAYSYMDDAFYNPYGHTDYYDPHYNSACGDIWQSSRDEWFMTAPITSAGYISASTAFVTNEGFTYTQAVPSVVSTVVVGTSTSFIETSVTYTDTQTVTIKAFATISSQTLLVYASNFDFTATAPCCSTCTIYGGEVQVYTWPTPRPSPAVSILVDNNNFTFTSPSIYVAFRSLYTSNLCGIGAMASPRTLPFGERELSTATGWRYDTSKYSGRKPNFATDFTLATWGDKKDCRNIVTSFYQLAEGPPTNQTFANLADISAYYSTPGVTGSIITTAFSLYTVTYNECSPTLAAPTQIFTIDPAWTACARGINGLWDPPYTLVTGKGLFAFTTSTGTSGPSVPVTTSTPAAGSTPPSVTATLTVVPESQTPTSINDPPTSSDEVQPSQLASSPPASSIEIQPSEPANSNPPQTPTTNTPSQSSSDPPAQVPSPIRTITLSTPQQSSSAAQPSNSPISPINSVATPDPTSNPGLTSVIGSTQIIPGEPSASQGGLIVGSQTLIPGAPGITVSSQIISLQSDGSSIVVDGTAAPVPSVTTPTIEYVIGTQTLVAGAPEITISGSIISLVSGGQSFVMSGTTAPIASLAGSEGIGDVIATIGGFATPEPTPVGYNGTSFTGGASRREMSIFTAGLGVLVILLL